MIAAIEQPDGLHVILHTGRKGISVQVTTYCGKQFNAANGVIQVPDHVITSGSSWRSVVDSQTVMKPCLVCQTKIR
jgi:hypothetical protein